jgi:hypothetical protein
VCPICVLQDFMQKLLVLIAKGFPHQALWSMAVVVKSTMQQRQVGGWPGHAPATQTRPQPFWCAALLACDACIVLLSRHLPVSLGCLRQLVGTGSAPVSHGSHLQVQL